METRTKDRAQNLAIRCDGTGNEISESISNVLKLSAACARRIRRSRGRCCPTIPGVAP